MVDILTLALAHFMLGLAFFRASQRPDLDQDPALGAENDSGTPTVPRRPGLKTRRTPRDSLRR